MTKQIKPIPQKKPSLKIAKKPEFLDPRSEFGFKKIFGDLNGKEDLTNMLNAFGEGHLTPIKEIHLVHIEQPGATKESRKALYDIYALDQDNGQYSIEMQNQEIKYPINRTFFNLGNALLDSLSQCSEENFQITPITGVIIANYCIDKASNSTIINHIKYESSIKTFPKPQIHILTIELPKFKLKIHELKNVKDVFLYILNNLADLKTIPPQLDNEKYRPLFERARISNLNKTEMRVYNAYKKQEDRARLATQFKEEVAEHKGRAEGLTEGRAEGRTEGITEGTSIGVKIEATKVIKSLLQKGLFGLKEIAKIVDLPLKQVQQIEKEIMANSK